ncbi:MAG: TrkA family potassium uptake protein [Clostridia bacterium]|nr:TrkA family potassium uptake protein [Clostridia bacterium]
MSIHKTYAVFGLGRYGQAVAKELHESGAEVIGVDIHETTVNEVAAYLPVCKCADVTDVAVLRQLGIDEVDAVIVAMASSLESSVLTVALCKEIGVPLVVVKCGNETHRKILQRVGADRVVFPENESGVRLAKNLLSSGFVDVIELSRDVSMIEMDVRPEWVGKTLIELGLRKKYSLNVAAIREHGEVSIDIDPQRPLEAGMKLIVIADGNKINKLL